MYGNYNPYQNRFIGVPEQQSPFMSGQNNIISANRPFLSGKQVESIEVVKAMDIPLDGSISYYPIADGSAIVSKQLQMDGTSKMTIFKPIEEQKDDVRYITQDELKKSLEAIDLSDIEDLKEEVRELRKEIKEIKKKKKED